jgi:membrane-associated protease RseP (regulator of RpoE activity)
MVDAELDGIRGEFQIDTGARSSISIMHPFAVSNHLLEKYQAKTEVIAGYGFGGPARALLIRPQSLKIGSIEIKEPIGLIELGEKGVAANYEHQVLYLEPNASFAEPNVFDRSGLWCMQDEAGGLQIVDVVKNSPADKAGLQAGDHVLGLDGTAIKGSQIIDLRGKLKQASGTKVTLQVDGKAGKREVCPTLVELS